MNFSTLLFGVWKCKVATEFSLKHFAISWQISMCFYLKIERLFGLDMERKRERRGREQHRRKRQSKSERGSCNGSRQADDNLALTFRRHLQFRFNLNHNNQFMNCPENIKHVWCLQSSTGSWTVLWCVEDDRDCRYSPALTAQRCWLTSIVVLIGISYHRRSYKIRSPNVSRYIKRLEILPEFLKAVDWQLKRTQSDHSLVWFLSNISCESLAL